MDEVDIIIVGAGSAGCVLAARLAESGHYRVLLLEAGPADRSPWVHLPIGYGKLYYHPTMNWMYRTEPVPALDDRVIYQPRGKVVGGSSAINAMVYSRGQPGDFDDWAQMGNRGWSWDDILPVYRRMEDHAFGAGEWHGAGGRLHVSDISKVVHPLTHRYVQAAQEAGLPFTGDFNGPEYEGAGYYQLTTRGGMRESAARAFLRPAMKTGRIRLETDALATRVLFEGRRAVGVEYRQHGRLVTARARAEVVLSGGAFNSPQLLQLSGVGPGALLQEHGIDVVADTPAVGREMQDHLGYDHAYKSKVPSLNDVFLPLHGKVRVGLRYLFGKKGPLSLSVNQGGGFFRSRPEVDRPDIQLYFSPLSYEKATPGVRALMKPDPFSGFYTSVSPCRPTSRGRVEIRSNDPSDPPRIIANYFSTPEDVETLLAGARFLVRLAQTPSLSAVIESEIRPGEGRHSDEDLLADIRARAYSIFHPCGTCRMGPEPGRSVVDPSLRVWGFEGLRVADASIFPAVPSGNTNAPAMMVGEKAAELMLARTPAFA